MVNRHTGAVPDQYPSPTANYFNVLGLEVHKIRAVVDHGSDGQDDRDLAADLIALPRRRAKRTAAALVDLAASPKIKFACIDADPETRFEVGSITKGLTGMLLADAIDRGEVSLDTTIGDLLPGDEGTEFGSISLKELCTRTSGLPRMPRGLFTFLRGARFLLLGTHPYRAMTASGVLRAAARQRLRGRGEFQVFKPGRRRPRTAPCSGRGRRLRASDNRADLCSATDDRLCRGKPTTGGPAWLVIDGSPASALDHQGWLCAGGRRYQYAPRHGPTRCGLDGRLSAGKWLVDTHRRCCHRRAQPGE